MKSNFFKRSLLLLIAVISILFLSVSCSKKKGSGKIIPSLNAYSFSNLLDARDPMNKEQVYTLFNLLDWCAVNKIPALDPTAYFFPTYPEVPSDEYLQKFKNYAAKMGVVISGTGIRNDFASPDSLIRAEGVHRAKNWIVAASKMGAPVIRVFAGAVPKDVEWEVAAGWMIECYKELAEYGAQYGVKIGVQNHGDMLQTADQCIYVLKKVNSKWVGLIVDTGNFKTEDPYNDIAAVVPYAINWQVKESTLGLGSEIPIDYKRLVQIIKDGGYTGYVPVETLTVRGKSYDPFALVPGMIEELRKAIDEVY